MLDCAEGHILALEKAKPGERYILGGENLTLKQILDKLGAITGLPSPRIELPYAVAYATGIVDTLVTGKLRKRHPRVTLDAVRMGRKKMFVSSAKAERELGLEIRAGRQRLAAGGGLVPRQRLCLSPSPLLPRCGTNWGRWSGMRSFASGTGFTFTSCRQRCWRLAESDAIERSAPRSW